MVPVSQINSQFPKDMHNTYCQHDHRGGPPDKVSFITSSITTCIAQKRLLARHTIIIIKKNIYASALQQWDPLPVPVHIPLPLPAISLHTSTSSHAAPSPWLSWHPFTRIGDATYRIELLAARSSYSLDELRSLSPDWPPHQPHRAPSSWIRRCHRASTWVESLYSLSTPRPNQPTGIRSHGAWPFTELWHTSVTSSYLAPACSWWGNQHNSQMEAEGDKKRKFFLYSLLLPQSKLTVDHKVVFFLRSFFAMFMVGNKPAFIAY